MGMYIDGSCRSREDCTAKLCHVTRRGAFVLRFVWIAMPFQIVICGDIYHSLEFLCSHAAAGSVIGNVDILKQEAAEHHGTGIQDAGEPGCLRHLPSRSGTKLLIRRLRDDAATPQGAYSILTLARFVQA